MAWAASVRPSGMEAGYQGRDGPLYAVQGQRFADDAGGGRQEQGGGDGQQAGGGLGGGRGRGQSGVAGAGIGIAAVRQDGLGLAPAQPLLAEEDRCGLHFVGGKDPRGDGRLVRHDEGQIQAAGLFDRSFDRGGFESWDDEGIHGVRISFFCRKNPPKSPLKKGGLKECHLSPLF